MLDATPNVILWGCDDGLLLLLLWFWLWETLLAGSEIDGIDELVADEPRYCCGCAL